LLCLFFFDKSDRSQRFPKEEKIVRNRALHNAARTTEVELVGIATQFKRSLPFHFVMAPNNGMVEMVLIDASMAGHNGQELTMATITMMLLVMD
jgi:hypothetical protein